MISMVDQPRKLSGIVLAAGEGKRLRPLVQRWRGDDLPKQYVRFTGHRSMLEQTFKRAERLIAPDHLFTVVDRRHLTYPEVWRQLLSRPRGTVILQPENRETGPGLLLPLMHLYKRYSDATVVIFPSDHFIREEGLFIDHVDLAVRLISEDPSRLILLGMQTTGPDPEYGYILPGSELDHLAPSGIRQVIRFIEKPTPSVASELVRQGGLWNTMIMVVKVNRLMELARQAAPELTAAFEQTLPSIGTTDEKNAIEALYRRLTPVNFSKSLLETFPLQNPSSLAVLPIRGVYWSDWGSIHRVLNDLREMGCLGRHGLIEENEYLVT
ncbi:MAG: sugar phosphate nucleotidyltransferase [Candidatus Manganitrophaceae bacterium]